MAQQQDQPVEQYGIEETKPTLEIITTTITAVANMDSNKDGDIQTIEVLNSLQLVAFKVIRQIPDIKKLRQEATDYSEAEKEEIYNIIKANVSMPKAKIEYLVERALNIIIDLVDFVMEMQKPDEEFE